MVSCGVMLSLLAGVAGVTLAASSPRNNPLEQLLCAISPCAKPSDPAATLTGPTGCIESKLLPFECSSDAYLVLDGTLLQANVETGSSVVLAQDIGGLRKQLNGIGFNTLDNYLYGMQDNTVVRIGRNGLTEEILRLDRSATLGDVDSDGQYYYNFDGGSWGVVDLKPCSPAYGKVVKHGFSDLSLFQGGPPAPGDWAATPAVPGYLYSVVADKNDTPRVVRWSTQTNEWEMVFSGYSDSNFRGRLFGAILATGDGTVYAVDNDSGQTLRFPLFDLERASKAAVVPSSNRLDGAICAVVVR